MRLTTYVSASARNYMQTRHYYLKLNQVLKELDVYQPHNWIEQVEARIKANEPIHPTPSQWKEIYKQVIETIRRVDFVLVHNTIPSFSNGFITAFALSQGKPVLFLQRKEDEATYKRFIWGIDHPLLTIKFYLYDDQSFDIIREYVAYLRDSTTRRSFHLRLSEAEYRWLSEQEAKTKKSKTEIIRELIRERMGKEG